MDSNVSHWIAFVFLHLTTAAVKALARFGDVSYIIWQDAVNKTGCEQLFTWPSYRFSPLETWYEGQGESKDPGPILGRTEWTTMRWCCPCTCQCFGPNTVSTLMWATKHYPFPFSHSAPLCDNLPILTHSLSDLCNWNKSCGISKITCASEGV